jgi:hypothetical protein
MSKGLIVFVVALAVTSLLVGAKCLLAAAGHP